jgi:hypothetical protein
VNILRSASFFLFTALHPCMASAQPFEVDRASIEDLKRRDAALDREKADIKRRLNALSHRQGGAFERGAEKLYPSPPDKPAADPQKVSFCDQNQRIFIRADSLDNFLYTAPSAAKAEGASISFTDDRVSGSRTLAVNGQISYVLFRDLCPTTPKEYLPFISGWAVVPFVSAHGNFTSPRSKTEQSSTKVGVETQFELARSFGLFGDFPLRQVFTFSPYYQTDFRGEARAYGFNGYWDAYDLRYNLGGYLDTNPYLGWFLQLRGEADLRQVDVPGVTGLSRTSYDWAGGTARLTFVFFPSADVPPWLQDRFSLIASANYFHDFKSGMDIHLYRATVKYKLNPEGYSSIGFEYTNGTDKDTLVYAQKYMIKLLYAQ